MARLAAVVQALDISDHVAPPPPMAPPMAPPGAGPLPLPQLPQPDVSGLTLVSEASTHAPGPGPLSALRTPRTAWEARPAQRAADARDESDSRRLSAEVRCEELGRELQQAEAARTEVARRLRGLEAEIEQLRESLRRAELRAEDSTRQLEDPSLCLNVLFGCCWL